jgi:hypothetical protein
MPWWALWAGAGIVLALTGLAWWANASPWWTPVVAILVMIAGAAWWWLPQWQANRLSLKIRDPKARADLEDNFRKTIGQLLGGAAVLIGAGFAYYQSLLTQQATHDQIISQQVAKGFELLGDDKGFSTARRHLRLGGCDECPLWTVSPAGA